MLASIIIYGPMPTAAPLHCHRHGGHPIFVDITAVRLLSCCSAAAIVFGGRHGQSCIGRVPVVVGTSLSRSALGGISKVFCFAVAALLSWSWSSVMVCSARGCIALGVAATAAIILVTPVNGVRVRRRHRHCPHGHGYGW
ncbi:hypothetical protein EDB89DRAFT_1991695 [Lactarius sanguifluus]|nr:hypothetical protein EDB89DRAFT_1991695 [Lactarius sanguifluus]